MLIVLFVEQHSTVIVTNDLLNMLDIIIVCC